MIHQCVICRNLRGAIVQQKMSDFPTDRMEAAPPFTYTCVDLFGPFYIKVRRSVVKRYGVLLTCLASRAVHLEVAHTLETDAFIMVLRRFISRRGNVRLIRSDNGTYFAGADKQLHEEFICSRKSQRSSILSPVSSKARTSSAESTGEEFNTLLTSYGNAGARNI